MQFKKLAVLGLFVLFSAPAINTQIFAQESRPRRAPETSATQLSKLKNTVQQYPRNAPANSITVDSAPSETVKNSVLMRPSGNARNGLTNDLMLRATVAARPVAPTATTKPVAASGAVAAFNQRLLQSMSARLGIPYVYGSQGPNTYDCSGLVWSVFKEAGVDLERTSAATMWNKFEPATDENKYKFGTLVFFNRLGHIGIVIDENTFYQASSSKGVTFSKFAGYWEKRVVGFRRVPLEQFTNFIKPESLIQTGAQ